MSTIETLLAEIIDKKKRLDDLKTQSPEMAEALALSDLYHGLMSDLREMCNPPAQVMPMPYPVYPAHPWESPAIYSTDATCTAGTAMVNLSGVAANIRLVK